MKTFKPALRKLVVFLVGTGIAIAANAPQLTFSFKKAQLPGAQEVLPSATNNNGVEVGTYVDESGVSHGYIFDGKNLANLDDPNGSNTSPQGIQFNRESEVVGFYTNASGNSIGFLWNAETQQFTDILGPVGATASAAESVNDQGWIDGFYSDSNGVIHGFLLQGENYTTLDVPGAAATYLYGMNNQGNMAVTWVNSRGAYEGASYNYKTKTFTTINVPGAGPLGSEGSFINNKGDITLWWFDTQDSVHGALLHAGQYYKFDYPGAVETVANGINDKNVFVGQYQTKFSHPYLGYEATFK